MVPRNVSEIIHQHVVLEVKGIDRLYLNGYVSGLQTEGGFVHFVRQQLGCPIASTTLLSNAGRLDSYSPTVGTRSSLTATSTKPGPVGYAFRRREARLDSVRERREVRFFQQSSARPPEGWLFVACVL